MSDNKTKTELLVESWAEVLNAPNAAPIKDRDRLNTTAKLLENTKLALEEAAQGSGTADKFDPVLLAMVRRLAPKLIAFDVMGVQAMSGPTGLLFALRARYGTPTASTGGGAGTEALFDEANTAYSGTGTHTGDDPWDVGFSTGTGLSTAAGEAAVWNDMGFTIEKATAIATTRQLKASYTNELAQDLRAIHGLDAETELSNILSSELIAELNRECVRTIYASAKPGAQFASTPGVFDLNADSDGRWSGERIKGLRLAIERDANAIFRETRRGKGNILIVSMDVASALSMADMLTYSPVSAADTNLDVDVSGSTYAGKMGGFKVFVDPFMGRDGYVVGYKGETQYDAGIFYCPYVPLTKYQSQDPTTFKPILGFQTRYAIVSNPFTTLGSGSNVYYRKVQVLNLQ